MSQFLDPPAEPALAPTLRMVCMDILRQPGLYLLQGWNWKAAWLSAGVRGTLFFLATVKAGWRAAVGAFLLEAALYGAVAGFAGALFEAMHRVRPVWAATVTMMLLVPAFNHSAEFTLHWLHGTPQLPRAWLASLVLSGCSACFNLFAMRRGVLLVGAERRSMRSDLVHLPRLIAEFVASLSLALWRAPLALWRAWLR